MSPVYRWDPGPGWDPSEGLLRPEEAAALYGVDVQTIVIWALTRKLPAIRTPGGQWRFSRRWVREDQGRDQSRQA